MYIIAKVGCSKTPKEYKLQYSLPNQIILIPEVCEHVNRFDFHKPGVISNIVIFNKTLLTTRVKPLK